MFHSTGVEAVVHVSGGIKNKRNIEALNRMPYSTNHTVKLYSSIRFLKQELHSFEDSFLFRTVRVRILIS